MTTRSVLWQACYIRYRFTLARGFVSPMIRRDFRHDLDVIAS